MRYIVSLITFIIFSNTVVSQVDNHPLRTKDVQAQKKWVDSLYNNMSLEEKVGQLFMVRAFSNQSQAHVNSIAKLINENHIG
ncbi:MAG: hypothetical protein GYB35_10820, partial [Algicola sp.]|nr:hypothetical protein [Algicola sp.]